MFRVSSSIFGDPNTIVYNLEGGFSSALPLELSPVSNHLYMELNLNNVDDICMNWKKE